MPTEFVPTFRWVRRDAVRWLLKSEDGQIAAVVVPYRGEFARKGQFRAIALGEDRNRGTIHKYGCTHWVLGTGVASAKRGIERWFALHCWDAPRMAEAV